MFFTVYIAVVSAAILVGCIVAIVMSTSHGTAWLQSLWEGRRGRNGRDRDPSGRRPGGPGPG